MIQKIGYVPQLMPILKKKKEIEKQVQENRVKQKELQHQEEQLLIDRAILDAFVKHPEEFKKLKDLENKGRKNK